ncbi:MAG: succinylglutamate desuccinylase/aspartoacylase family protein [Nanoarchaeota archaeon]
MKKPNFAIIVCVHGDEKYGVEVIKKIKKFTNKTSVIIANPEALKKNKRFVDVDLNRCFPGKARGNREERIAFSLTKALKQFDYVIDLHSSSTETEPFIITTRISTDHKKLISCIPVRKVVIMTKKLAKGKALIDHCKCGVSIEIGQHQNKNNAAKAVSIIRRMLINIKNFSSSKKIFFKAYGISMHGDPHPPKLKNFVHYVEKKSKVYPLLITPKEYAGDSVHYLKARRINYRNH